MKKKPLSMKKLHLAAIAFLNMEFEEYVKAATGEETKKDKEELALSLIEDKKEVIEEFLDFIWKNRD